MGGRRSGNKVSNNKLQAQSSADNNDQLDRACIVQSLFSSGCFFNVQVPIYFIRCLKIEWLLEGMTGISACSVDERHCQHYPDCSLLCIYELWIFESGQQCFRFSLIGCNVTICLVISASTNPPALCLQDAYSQIKSGVESNVVRRPNPYGRVNCTGDPILLGLNCAALPYARYHLEKISV